MPEITVEDTQDSYYMGLAIARARRAAEAGEVPVGAILILNGNIYSSDGNAREATHDPTAHAEVLALRHAAERIGNWRLENATLYVTAEPCLLCTGALYLARVKRVVFGCMNPKGGALHYVHRNEHLFRLNHSLQVTSGVREMDCARLLKDFFSERRLNKERTRSLSPTPPTEDWPAS